MSRQGMRTVLLVDAAADDRAMYAEYLRIAGFRTIGTGHTADALALAATADVIVTGVRVPGAFDGIELIRRLRADAQTSGKPIIVVTASSTGPNQQRAYSAGCDRFLAKPCLPETLAIQIRYALAVRSEPRPRVFKRDARSPSKRIA